MLTREIPNQIPSTQQITRLYHFLSLSLSMSLNNTHQLEATVIRKHVSTQLSVHHLCHPIFTHYLPPSSIQQTHIHRSFHAEMVVAVFVAVVTGVFTLT